MGHRPRPVVDNPGIPAIASTSPDPPLNRLHSPLRVMVILGLKGNEMAWRSKQWESPEKFLAVQQRWATWSIVFAIGALVALILFLLGQG